MITLHKIAELRIQSLINSLQYMYANINPHLNQQFHYNHDIIGIVYLVIPSYSPIPTTSLKVTQRNKQNDEI